jgi:hypothetical protein
MGYDVHTGGRGMVMISQSRPEGGFSQMGFSLLNDATVEIEELEMNVGDKRGLVMNNRFGGAGAQTNEATPDTANVFAVPHSELDEWQEFWITVEALATPVDGNTHEVNVYHNGSLTPETFQLIVSPENEFHESAYLATGLSSDTRQGAFDLDFIAYKEGIFTPTLAPAGLAGDYNDNGSVDAADYVAWRDKLGTSFSLPNETVTLGSVTTEDYDEWKANFGAAAASGSAHAAVPEPISMSLAILAAALIGCLIRDRR